MMAKLLARSIRTICVGGVALGITTAMAQDTSVALQHVDAMAGERLVVVAYSDPETEIGNGTYPPRREANSGTEAGDDLDVSVEVDNSPESEIGNGTFPPDLNPMGLDTSIAQQEVEAVASERLIVVAYSDPEGEISNGSDPPDPNFIDPETDVASETDQTIGIYNFPESEISNGIDPPL